MSVCLTPSVTADESGKDTISLVGSGDISGHLPMEFSKPFDVAVSVAPGKEQEIASGNGQFGDNSVRFAVTALATIEGRVKLPFAKDEDSGNPIKLIKAREALQEADVLYRKAKADLEDVEQLFKSGLCPESDLNAAKTAFGVAQIHLDAAKQTLDAEQQQAGGFGGGGGGGAGGRGR